MMLLMTKASKHLINNRFKALALQQINHVKLKKTLEPRKKNRIYRDRSIFMRHPKDKAGEKQHMSDKDFLRTNRMSRKVLKNLADKLKDRRHF